MKIKIYIVQILLICNLPFLMCQGIEAKKLIDDGQKDSISISFDSIPTMFTQLGLDSLTLDSLMLSNKPDSIENEDLTYRLSKDAIEDEVKYDARDSSWIDLVNEKIHLYGGAQVNFQSIELKANYMVIDFANNIIEGFAKKDSTSKDKEKPTFKEGDNTFTYNEIKYNFKSKKGLVNHAISQQGEFNLVGSTTKFIAGQTDSLGVKEDDRIYNKDAIITTCTHDPPHFGIRAGKLKFVPNKLAVMSVAQVEIARVPTPLFLPFGFFPLAKGKSSGLIFPSSYEYNEQLGLGFREIGYYWPINNKVDLKVVGDIYTRGSYAIRTTTNYKKLYAYSGSILLGYSNNIRENATDGSVVSQKSFNINISHSQDAKAHPYRNLGGSINIQTNRYDQRVYENPTTTLNNTYSSNFTFSHDMPGTPFRFSAEMRHSQNVQTRVMDITLPNMTLRMNTIYPFKKKNSTKEVWTDNVALSYSSEFRNFVKTTDTTLFTQQTLNDLQTGLQQKANLSTNFRLFKYINVSPNVNYEETWLLKKYQLTFNKDSILLDTLTNQPLTFDTLGYKAPTSSFISDLGAYRNVTAGISFNTQRFFNRKFSKGFIRGFRHVAKPNVSISYKPENKERYEAKVDIDTRADFNDPRTYSVFTNSPFGTLQGSEEQLSLGYGITNIFEMKYWSKKDTSEKIVRLFDNISLNGNYNFAVDSLNWSPVSISGNTTVLRKLTNFNFRSVFSPYVYDANDKITTNTVWSKNRILPEFRNLSGQFTTSLTFGRIFDMISGKKEDDIRKQNDKTQKPQETNVGINLTNSDDEETNKKEIKETSLKEWFTNFNISHNFNFEYRRLKGRDTLFVSSHSINIAGSIPLTKNWNMNINNIAYDFKNKSFVYPHFGFQRDLHCWAMNFIWAPENGVYSFYIGVKSSGLSFLKYDYGQRNANTLFTGQR